MSEPRPPEHEADISACLPTEAGRAAAENFRVEHRTQVLTILLSDLQDSTRQQSKLGNLRAAELVQEHRRIFRDVLTRFDGGEVETAGDSFLAVFAAPSEGVAFALHLQAAMREARAQHPDLPQVRAGLHQGQVVVERHTGPHKRMDIYGLQVSTAARIMDLGGGGQILCSRAVFDDARAILRGDQLAGLDDVVWRNHGPYVFKGVEVDDAPDRYEVCEVGEAGHAGFERPPGSPKSHPAEAGDEIFGWRPGPDALLPNTNWRMEMKLGEGGFGEVWLAQDCHLPSRKTVFKFCTKRSKVKSLRREYDVFNRLAGSTGKTPPGIVEVLGAHDEGDPPYYIQLEYVSGGNLRDWIEGPGKTAPFRIRHALARQMARVIARIHAAGLVHRDIKPSNFLLEMPDDPERAPALKVCDFGIGQVVLQETLAESRTQIRQTGASSAFSVHTASLAQAAGTYLFIAPELLLGKSDTPGSIAKDALPAADVYSVGVTLYQLFAGDASLAPGVDLPGIDDPIVREDVAACLNSVPANRPRAEDLDPRLENHDARLRACEQAVHRRKLRRVAAIAVASAVIAVFATFMSINAYKNQQEAQRQREKAEEATKEAVAATKEATTNLQTAEKRLYVSLIQRITQLSVPQQAGPETAQPAESALRLRQARQLKQVRQLLWDAPERLRGWEWGYYLLRADGKGVTLETEQGARATSACFNPSGERVLAALDNGTLRVWDAQSAEKLDDLSTGSREEDDAPHELSASFCVNGSHIAAVSAEGEVWVWRAKAPDHELLLHLPAGAAPAVSATLSPDGARLLTASAGGALILWDTTEDAELARTSAPELTGDPMDKDATARVWTSASYSKDIPRAVKRASVSPPVFSPDGALAFFLSEDGALFAWPCSADSEPRYLGVRGRRVSTFSLSRDGEWLLAGLDDGEAYAWRWEEAEPGTPLGGAPHESGIAATAWSADAALMAIGSYDGEVRILNRETGEVQLALRPDAPAPAPISLAFSPDSRQLLGIHSDRSVRLWDARNGQEVLDPISLGETGPFHAAFSSARGRSRLLTLADGEVRLWETSANPDSEVFSRSGSGSTHETAVTRACMDQTGAMLLTAALDGRVMLWDAGSGNLAHALEEFTAPAGTAAQSTPTGPGSVTAPLDERDEIALAYARFVEERFNDVPAAEPVGERMPAAELSAPAAPAPDEDDLDAIAAAFSAAAEARFGAEPADETAVTVGQAVLDKPVAPGDPADETTAALSSDGRLAATALPGGALLIWDCASGQLLHRLEPDWAAYREEHEEAGFSALDPDRAEAARAYIAATQGGLAGQVKQSRRVTALCFSGRDARLLAANSEGVLCLWDTRDGRLVWGRRAHPVAITAASFSPDGTRVLTASADSTARLWDAASGEPVREFGEHTRHLAFALFSPCGTFVLTGSGDNTARLWEAQTGERLYYWRTHTDAVLCGAFSPDGSRVLTGSADSTVRMWNVATGAEERTLHEHGDGVVSIRFDSDGTRIITASRDGTARVWDAEGGEELAVLAPPDAGPLVDAFFTPDNRHVITASHDGAVRVWHSAPWRLEDLPGTGADWEARFQLWKQTRFQELLNRRQGRKEAEQERKDEHKPGVT